MNDIDMCMWRFEFGIKKCATLAFNSLQNNSFRLGVGRIDSVKEYTHVGIPILASGTVSKAHVMSRIDSCRGAFYAMIGCSLFNTSLSPISLSKIYWSVVIPKLLYGAEVKHYSVSELDEYEKFHRSMARGIQCLPVNTANPAIIATMGWRSISSQVDICKLCFIQRILSLECLSVYRVMFIRRFYYVLHSGTQTPLRIHTQLPGCW